VKEKWATVEARVTFDRVGGGWPSNQQFTEVVVAVPRRGETPQFAIASAFVLRHFPAARILRIELITESAVIETCDCCGKEIGVSQATVETGGVYCEKCRNQETK
jgi:hypothetical protein